jgi:dehydrogenase/reductase SDR family protein 7B
MCETNISIAAIRGDGSPYPKMDPEVFLGISAEECARDILTKVGKGKPEVYIGGPEHMRCT